MGHARPWLRSETAKSRPTCARARPRTLPSTQPLARRLALPGARRFALPGFRAFALLAALVATAATAEEEPAPFAQQVVQLPGRAVEAFVARAGLARAQLVAISVEGIPPDERRHVTVFEPWEPGAPARVAWSLEVERDVVAVDAGELGPAPGTEIALLAAVELRIADAGAGPPLRISLEPPLPLPPRTRQLSRLPMLRDWNGDGTLTALVPSLEGARLVSPTGARARPIRVPVLTLYETGDESLPLDEGYAVAELTWPHLEQADDDGDGRPDLFAFTRFDVSVFRSVADGLETRPTRQHRFAPFSAEEEERHETTSRRAFARDVDGDGRADLVVHRTEGSLRRSHAETRVHANPGTGATPDAPAAATLAAEGAFGTVQMVDLDGDGRLELIQTAVPFGVLQLIRVLVQRRVEASLRVVRFEGPGIGAAQPGWSVNLGYGLDFAEGRIVGLLPTAEGDWNGDGLRDLLHGEGAGKVRIRLGQVEDAGPGFGGPSVRFEVAGSVDGSVVGDLDGDGLDDLVLYDTLDPRGRLVWCRNRGALPGGPPSLRPAVEEPDARADGPGDRDAETPSADVRAGDEREGAPGGDDAGR